MDTEATPQRNEQIHHEYQKNNEKSDVCSDTTLSLSDGSSSDSDSESHNSSSPTVFSTPLPSNKMEQDLDFQTTPTDEKKKLKAAEDEIYELKTKLEETETALAKMGSIEERLEKESTKSLMLLRKILDLEAKLEHEKKHVQDLEEKNINLEQDISIRDSKLKGLNVEIQDTLGAFANEKWQLESSVITLSQNVNFLELREQELQTERDSLAATIMQYETEKLEAKRTIETAMAQFKEEINSKNKLVDTLNADLDALKLKNDTLEAEKHDLEAGIRGLRDDLGLREERIQGLENYLHEVQCEKQQLVTESNQTNKLVSELKSRVEILENEIVNQATMISDTAEGKKEAIRQLCFSLDHFRSAYEELRNMYGLIKKPTALIFKQ